MRLKNVLLLMLKKFNFNRYNITIKMVELFFDGYFCHVYSLI